MAAKKIYIKVNCEECIACGICQLKAPHLFEYDDDGIAFAVKDENQGTLPLENFEIDSFKEAYTNCPTGAIKRSSIPFTE